MHLNIQETFNKELPQDPDTKNTRRQIFESCYSLATPRVPGNPSLIHTSPEMVEAIGLKKEDANSEDFLKIFTGAKVIENTTPFAMCYGGHQFGNWAGQLGDGRAINLTEVLHDGQRWALQLKGAGETPYSRTADGLAVLRSSIREHLCSEAMHHLGVPTTRSLSLSLTGDQVMRDMMYDGNAAYEKGAVVCRVSPSFVRFGNFQIFASRSDVPNLKKLTDYTIKHFYPNIEVGTKQGYIDFFQQVVHRTLKMVVEWQRVGFVHGVMNTDNLSILGLTIDYGPYGWLENYDPNWTPNTTDNQFRRYRFGNQPGIALWNLNQLANAIYLLVNETKPFEDILNSYSEQYAEAYMKMMYAKVGLATIKANDSKLISDLTETLQLAETDMTIFFRLLANVKKDDTTSNVIELITPAFYQELNDDPKQKWMEWFQQYIDRLQSESNSDEDRKAAMNKVNPKYVLRNYMAQLAIDEADKGAYGLVHSFYEMLTKPYAEQPEFEKWFAKRPEWARHKVGCSMLSCSS